MAAARESRPISCYETGGGKTTAKTTNLAHKNSGLEDGLRLAFFPLEVFDKFPGKFHSHVPGGARVGSVTLITETKAWGPVKSFLGWENA